MIRVFVICHFSNQGIRNRLILDDSCLYHDFAVWISDKISAFEKRDEIELHIVSPHKGMKRSRQEFVLNGVHYYFFNAGKSLGKLIKTSLIYALYRVQNKTYKNLVQLLNYAYSTVYYLPQRYYVKKLVSRTKPDIIHLYGAENPYYSSTIIGLEKTGKPICVTIQGMVSSSEYVGQRMVYDYYRERLEIDIHQRFSYYLLGPEHYDSLISQNPKAQCFLYLGIRTINIDPMKEHVAKDFDFVFFARIVKSKGIEQLLKAISILKADYPNIQLAVMGPSTDTYLTQLKELCDSYRISSNVKFMGHISKREDLFKEALRAKIYVLPTLFEGLATSAVEAMLLGLPVVTYATGGMPLLNNNGENVLMSETGDINGLVLNMKRLLDNPEYADKLSKRGQEFAKLTFAEETNTNLIIRQYKAILSHYYDDVPVPEDLVYSGKFNGKPYVCR